MNNEFFDALDILERERHIPKQYMLEKVEAALAAACKKEYGAANITVVIDPDKRDVKVYRKFTIVAEVEDPRQKSPRLILRRLRLSRRKRVLRLRHAPAVAPSVLITNMSFIQRSFAVSARRMLSRLLFRQFVRLKEAVWFANTRIRRVRCSPLS